MPSLAAQAAGIRSLFLKPSSKLSTSGKAVGCKVRLRLVLPYCPLSPLRKCAPLRFRAADAVLHLLCAHILRGRTGTRDCILHFSASAPALRLQTRRAEALRWHSAPCSVGPGCSVQTLPSVSDCAKPARPAAATPCLLAPEADCMPRLAPRHTDSPGRRAYIVAYVGALQRHSALSCALALNMAHIHNRAFRQNL